MARLTREQILARKLGQEEVDVGDGDTVLVRGLSRAEAHDMQEIDGARGRDMFMIRTGMVDPLLSDDDVVAWFAGDQTGVLDRVAAVITRLSGMAPGQAKDATKSVPRRRGSGRA